MRPALIIIILAIVGLSLGGWYFFSQKSQIISSPSSLVSVSATILPSSNPSSTPQLPTPYISAVDWPPQIRIAKESFTCTEADVETDRAGQTKNVTINSHTYCVTKVSEGAAGSVYTQYAYARAYNNQTQIFTFSLRFVQCGNYSDPQQTKCTKAQQSFIVDEYIDQYIQSMF